MRKQNSFKRSQSPAENHRVRYGVRSELYLTLKLDCGVRELAETYTRSTAREHEHCMLPYTFTTTV